MQKNEIKDIFILSCYPNVPEKERLLNEMVDKLKLLNKTVLLASHFPVPQYIVKKCDYYIYDAYNMLDVYNHTLDKDGPDYWMQTDHFFIQTTITHHPSALSRIFGITMNFIKSLGFNYFVITETDAEYDINDLKKFDLYQNKLIKENKDLFFFKPKFIEYNYNNEFMYETYCFGGFLEKFLNKFQFPINLNDWNELIKENVHYKCFEHLLYKKFKDDENKHLILSHMKNQFLNSKIDLFTSAESSGVFYNVSNPNRPILFLHNHDHLQRPSIYEVKINTHPLQTIALNCGGWHYFDLDLNFEKTLSVSIKTYRDNKLYSDQIDYITPENLEQKKLFKKFTFIK